MLQVSSELRLCVIHANRKLTGFETNWHEHPFYELGMVFEGVCEWKVQGRDSYHLKAGQMILLPPGCSHRELVVERGHHLGWLGFQCLEWPKPESLFRVISQGETAVDFRYLLNRLYTEQRQDHLKRAEICALTVEHLLLLFQRAAGEPDRLVREKDHPLNHRQIQIVQSLAAYLDQNALHPLSLNQLAAYHHLSASHLSRLFQAYYLITPTGYRLQKRIESARELLEAGVQSVKEIAVACGFTDAAHFCKEFKRQTGQTPSRVRRGSLSPK